MLIKEKKLSSTEVISVYTENKCIMSKNFFVNDLDY